MENPPRNDRAGKWSVGGLLGLALGLLTIQCGLPGTSEQVQPVETTTTTIITDSPLLRQVGKLVTASRSAQRRFGMYGPKRFLADGEECSPAGRFLAEHNLYTRVGETCWPATGLWNDVFSGEQTRKATVDHVVPWDHAWRAGAGDWENTERARFAQYPANMMIVAIDTALERDGQSPADWLPEQNVCVFVERWVTVKLEWGLTAQPFEKSELGRIIKRQGGCNPGATTTP